MPRHAAEPKIRRAAMIDKFGSSPATSAVQYPCIVQAHQIPVVGRLQIRALSKSKSFPLILNHPSPGRYILECKNTNMMDPGRADPQFILCRLWIYVTPHAIPDPCGASGRRLLSDVHAGRKAPS
jgi:hypothetical protein